MLFISFAVVYFSRSFSFVQVFICVFSKDFRCCSPFTFTFNYIFRTIKLYFCLYPGLLDDSTNSQTNRWHHTAVSNWRKYGLSSFFFYPFNYIVFFSRDHEICLRDDFFIHSVHFHRFYCSSIRFNRMYSGTSIIRCKDRSGGGKRNPHLVWIQAEFGKQVVYSIKNINCINTLYH